MTLGSVLGRAGRITLNTSDGISVTMGGGLQSFALSLIGIPHMGARLRYRRLRAAIGKRRFRRSLEIGCGAGLLTAAFGDRADRAFGFDLDIPRLATAARLAPLMPCRFHALRADACRIPLADGSCDLVLHSEVIEHITDDTAAIREARRVLSHDGLLLLTTTADQPWNIEAEEEFDHARAGYARTALEGLALRTGLHVRSCTPYGRSALTRSLWRLHRASTRRSAWLGGLLFLPCYLLALLAESIVGADDASVSGKPEPTALGWILVADLAAESPRT